MGVVHSMDDAQVQRISQALKGSADAIQGINSKFDEVDGHLQNVQGFNKKINRKIAGTVDAFDRFDSTFDARVENVLVAVESASQELTKALEQTLETIQRFDVRRELDQLPKSFIPLTIPLILLLIELAVSNAYLGILLSAIPEVRNRYSSYLLANATAVLFGLTLSLVWLIFYRLWLSYKTHYPGTSREDYDFRFGSQPLEPMEAPEGMLRHMGTAEIQAELARRNNVPSGPLEDSMPTSEDEGSLGPQSPHGGRAEAGDASGSQALSSQEIPRKRRSRSVPDLSFGSQDMELLRRDGIPSPAPVEVRGWSKSSKEHSRRLKRAQSATPSLQSCSSEPAEGRRKGLSREEVGLLLQRKRAEALAREESSGRLASKTARSGSKHLVHQDGDSRHHGGLTDKVPQKSKPKWKWSAPFEVEVTWGNRA